METILLKILEAQHEILAELRLLRQTLSPAQPKAPHLASPVEAAPPPQAQAPEPRPAPAAAPASAPASTPVTAPPPPVAPREQSGGMLTVNELTDLGGQFLDPGQRNRSRVKPVDATALSHSILDDIKAKNKAKRSAFAEFDKFDKGR
ncbi:hypothetical protein DFW101_2990 [Solidesulfovibrio carbinoliphilus subsp. oakridgensis]|uniref:Uncharacterized protein n=1 Tax=Solidesulfovibrio carbinoliphilus subsp. oakridgensis TaxID=694327 RepID=G7Q5I9_9BACT|nr:hypothetical protein [Solidesulfovibrio carbinoliphilus]EHJ48990.1 hypothetical protein DFW101_2990 [Solidesulfovibrio carbinoliphilus subsp. oakridgensis]